MNLGRSRFAGLAAALCAIALLLGLGLRASFAEDFGTSTNYETGSAPARTAPAGKSKYSRSASLAGLAPRAAWAAFLRLSERPPPGVGDYYPHHAHRPVACLYGLGIDHGEPGPDQTCQEPDSEAVCLQQRLGAAVWAARQHYERATLRGRRVQWCHCTPVKVPARRSAMASRAAGAALSCRPGPRAASQARILPKVALAPRAYGWARYARGKRAFQSVDAGAAVGCWRF
jgi:hypothetical protein